MHLLFPESVLDSLQSTSLYNYFEIFIFMYVSECLIIKIINNIFYIYSDVACNSFGAPYRLIACNLHVSYMINYLSLIRLFSLHYISVKSYISNLDLISAATSWYIKVSGQMRVHFSIENNPNQRFNLLYKIIVLIVLILSCTWRF